MKIMYLPKFEDLVNKVYDRFKNKFNKLYVKTVPLWDMNNEMNLMKYTPEQLDFIHATQ